MFRLRMDRGNSTADDWRAEQGKYRSQNGLHHSTAASVLQRRAIGSNSSAHRLLSPFQLPGAAARRAATGTFRDVAADTIFLHRGSMRFPSHMSVGSNAVSGGNQSFGNVTRRRGAAGGGGEPEAVGGRVAAESEMKKKMADSKQRRSTFRRLWAEAKQEKKHLAAAGVCLLASSSANLMAPAIMAKAIDRASKRGGGSGSSRSVEMCIAGRPVSDRTFFLACLGVFAAGSLASWGRVYALAMATAGVAKKLRSRLFASLMLQEKEFFDEKKAGELTPIMAEDVDVSSTVFTERMASLLRSLNSSINASIALLSISPHLTMVSLSTVPMVGSVAMLYYKHVRNLSMRLRQLDSEAQAFAQARLANVRTVRAFANETLEAQRFEQAWTMRTVRPIMFVPERFTEFFRFIIFETLLPRVEQLLEEASQLRANEASAQGFFKGSLFGMVGVSLMAVLWVGGSHVGDGSMTAGQLTSFAGYTGWVGLGFSGLATGNANIVRGLASAERVFALVDRTPAVAGDEGIEPTPDVVGDLEFRDVWFQYQNRDKAVLQGVSLKLTPGKVLALTGASGEGKSTLATLITRLYEPRQGTITLDGVDIAKLNPSWLRKQIGVVDQEPILFAGSVEENIRYGVPSATKEQVEAAARQANAHNFIMDFPEGYDTRVGDEGRQLSGGQKQRVAIARAVLKNPPILILDEATSALDAESERLVSEAVDNVVTSRTVLVIAHRQSTVRKADSVAVLKDGVVAEQGTFRDLMEKPDSLLANLMEGGH